MRNSVEQGKTFFFCWMVAFLSLSSFASAGSFKSSPFFRMGSGFGMDRMFARPVPVTSHAGRNYFSGAVQQIPNRAAPSLKKNISLMEPAADHRIDGPGATVDADRFERPQVFTLCSGADLEQITDRYRYLAVLIAQQHQSTIRPSISNSTPSPESDMPKLRAANSPLSAFSIVKSEYSASSAARSPRFTVGSSMNQRIV
jgi:hypothetical protein